MKPKSNLIISHYTLRLMIGAMGFGLPLALFLAKWIQLGDTQIEISISDYYDNGAAGDILVGVLFVLGFFLFSYKGYDKVDDFVATAAGFFALGVALFPDTTGIQWVSTVHLSSAMLLFTCFIVFSIYLFRKTESDPEHLPKPKKYRNRVYFTCGVIMIVAILTIILGYLFFKPYMNPNKVVFWCEAVALMAFGFSWIVKSEYLFWKDA